MKHTKQLLTIMLCTSSICTASNELESLLNEQIKSNRTYSKEKMRIATHELKRSKRLLNQERQQYLLDQEALLVKRLHDACYKEQLLWYKQINLREKELHTKQLEEASLEMEQYVSEKISNNSMLSHTNERLKKERQRHRETLNTIHTERAGFEEKLIEIRDEQDTLRKELQETYKDLETLHTQFTESLEKENLELVTEN